MLLCVEKFVDVNGKCYCFLLSLVGEVMFVLGVNGCEVV